MSVDDFEEPEAVRVCAQCEKRLNKWTPAHPVEGESGVLCTQCRVGRRCGLISSSGAGASQQLGVTDDSTFRQEWGGP